MSPARSILVFLLATAPLAARPQGSAEDYARAAALPERLADTVVGARLEHGWAPDGRLWFARDGAGGAREFLLVDPRGGAVAPAFDHGMVALMLSGLGGETVLPDHLPVEHVAFEDDGSLRLLLGGEPLREARVTAEGVGVGDLDASGPFVVAVEPPREVDPGERRAWNPGGARGTLVFVNRWDRKVTARTWDRGAYRVRTVEVEPGATVRQPTRAGQRWRLTDAAADRELGTVAGRAGAAVVFLDAPVEPKAVEPEAAPGASEQQAPSEPPVDAAPRVTFRDHDAWLVRPDGTEVRLTDDGSEAAEYRGPVHVAPRGAHVAFFHVQRGAGREISFVESSPERGEQPRLHTFSYAKPGDELDVTTPRVFAVETGEALPLDAARFENPWSIDHGHWTADGTRFLFLFNQRGHRVMRLLELDVRTGATRAVVDEAPATFFDYAHKLFVQHLEATDEVLWTSERSGWNHLWRIERATGAAHAVTSGEWVVREVQSVDEAARTAVLRVRGRFPDQDPYFDHWARVDLDTGALVALTASNGTHEIELSPDGAWLLDTWSRVDQPPVHELRRAADGALVAELARADASAALAVLGRAPEPFVAKGRDGTTDIWGVIHRPTNFVAGRKYPVLEAIYAGPQDAYVPKSFSPRRGVQDLCELGFVVVQIDGMGTNWRSKAFHDVAWHDLADAGFPDRIAWLRAAAAKYPELDLDRVGVWGGSAGGQNAMRAVLDHADVYRAAAADCGCHDNRMDKVWWNELWLGWPVTECYAASSNVEHADRLGGALLLTVGETDRNVDPASTMQVVDALIRADKDFELIVFPGGGHGSGDSPYGRRRRADFFVRELMGVEPRWTGAPEATSRRQHNAR